MSAAPTFSLVLLAVGAVLVAVGLFLLKRGRWPRRVGNTAHCGACDYILSGAQAKCPECGMAVRAENIVRGERHRRPALAWSGVAVALFGLALCALFLGGLANSINWNRYTPLSWLLRDLDSPRASRTAWAEIQRRLDGGLLSNDEQNAVVDKGLQVQASGTTQIASPNIIDFVGQRYLDHKLTAAQADQFLASALKVRLAVRSVVGSHDLVPYSIIGGGRGPMGWLLRVRPFQAQIDQGPVQKLGGVSGMSFGGWSITSSMPPVGTPGKHRLRIKIEMATGLASANWNNNLAAVDAIVPNRVTKDLIADFQVIDGQTPIATVTTPSAAVLAPLLTPRLTLNRPSGMQMQLRSGVDVGPLPVDVAFDMFARFDGKEYPLGSVIFHKGEPGKWATGVINLPVNPPTAVDLIFRSNEQVARGTRDITRIWKGQIIIPHVLVHRPPGAPPATQAS